MTDGNSDNSSQLVVTLAALAAGLVAQQVVSVVWRTVRGTNPAKDDDVPLADALVFAAVSAATLSVVRTWAAKRARSR